VQRGKIVLTPQGCGLTARSSSTATMNTLHLSVRTIDAQLAESLEDVKRGRLSPAFETIADFAASLKLKADAKKLKAKTKRSARRENPSHRNCRQGI